MKYIIKDVSNPVMDVDTVKRCVKVAFSCIGNKDLDGDVIMPGAFDKTWAERGPRGKNMIWHIADHNPSLKCIVGKPKELGYDQNYAYGITPVANTSFGDDMIKMYGEGLINQHSFGFSIPQGRSEVRDDVRYIKEVMQFEYSSVLWGANPETPTLDVMKSWTKVEFDNHKSNLNDRLEKLLKAWKNGTFTDEFFPLLEVEIKQIQQSISDMSTYAANAPTPDNDIKAVFEAINSFNSKFK